VEPSRVDADAAWAFLGRTAEGTGILLAAVDLDADEPVAGAAWGSLRVVGGDLPDGDTALFVTAVSLARWLLDAPFCPRCGGATEIRAGGWSRRCTQCGREHFPRTDPAVIVLVTDPASERILLGKNALWADRNLYSAFAGFVESGESLEGAILREVEEEAGVVVSALQYRGSQAWPYPRSLMVGFRAAAAAPSTAHADGEEIVDVRWFTRAEVLDALAGTGDVHLPARASIAHRLIADWARP
ncbi:MAG: NAD(+) diphosphatase, partial [Microbacterium sp.]